MRTVTIHCDICCREIDREETVYAVAILPRDASKTAEVAEHEWQYGDCCGLRCYYPDVCSDCRNKMFADSAKAARKS